MNNNRSWSINLTKSWSWSTVILSRWIIIVNFSIFRRREVRIHNPLQPIVSAVNCLLNYLFVKSKLILINTNFLSRRNGRKLRNYLLIRHDIVCVMKRHLFLWSKTFDTFVYSQIVYSILFLIIMKDKGPEVFRLNLDVLDSASGSETRSVKVDLVEKLHWPEMSLRDVKISQKQVRPNSSLDFLKNNTTSSSTLEGLIFDKSQSRVCFNYYINEKLIFV